MQRANASDSQKQRGGDVPQHFAHDLPPVVGYGNGYIALAAPCPLASETKNKDREQTDCYGYSRQACPGGSLPFFFDTPVLRQWQRKAGIGRTLPACRMDRGQVMFY